jgi:hypothetical protein
VKGQTALTIGGTGTGKGSEEYSKGCGKKGLGFFNAHTNPVPFEFSHFFNNILGPEHEGGI